MPRTEPTSLDPRHLEREALKATVAQSAALTSKSTDRCPAPPKSIMLQHVEKLPDHSQIKLVYEGLTLINGMLEVLATQARSCGGVDAMMVFAHLNCETTVLQQFTVDRAGQLKAFDEESREAKFSVLLDHDLSGQGDMECALEIVEDMVVDFNRELPPSDAAA